jgi:hypothetical protein
VIRRRSSVLLDAQRGIEAVMDLNFVPKDGIAVIFVTRSNFNNRATTGPFLQAAGMSAILR